MNVDELEGKWIQFKRKLKQEYSEKKDESLKEAGWRPQQLGPQNWGNGPTEWMRFTRD